MHFSRTLKNSIYEPWKDSYIDYAKLKHLLREDDRDEEQAEWTDDDESKFVEELVNVQLEKVNAFQAKTYKSLEDRVSKCEDQLEEFKPSGKNSDTSKQDEQEQKSIGHDKLSDILKELDSISKDISELERYRRINFSGFLKAAKKHDRRRGAHYKVRPLLQVRLAALPFNSEDFSPLLYRLSAMYSFTRQRLEGVSERPHSIQSETRAGGERYISHKFWIHPENLLEVKTYVLRRLPVLVYNPQGSKVVESSESDPSMTSLYFDNPQFSLYDGKIAKTGSASSLRLRWTGQLEDKPEIFLEKKTIDENGRSEEFRFTIKEKYIQPFIDGNYKMERKVEKLREREGTDQNGAGELKSTVEEIQNFIAENHLQPMLRANYTRTAFQIPGDNRIRISIDTDLALIREDALDQDRPCRAPDEWHRGDIDRLGLRYPFSEIRKGEISRFPYALLEIKVKEGNSKKSNDWINDLMSSHLLKEEPQFSKFVHGISLLFEDYVNCFPFWLKDLETDIRKDPEAAFQEEQDKKAKQAADEAVAESFKGSKSPASFQRAVGSPAGKPAADIGKQPSPLTEEVVEPTAEREPQGVLSGLLSLSSLSNSKYARAHRHESVELPPGVRPPGKLIKDMNPVRVEPKVWLANQRTFIKWQHITVLLATLSLGLYNAAGVNNDVARTLAVVYTLIAIFAGWWGWWVFRVRSQMILERSAGDFDYVVGPIVVCIGLVIALLLNFTFKYTAVTAKGDNLLLQNYTILHEGLK